jgi:aspartate aminotransferase-like enzyme
MVELLAELEAPLQRLFCTERRVMIGTCAATGFMEMAARCGIRQRTLSLVGGAFGERFAAISRACGNDVVRLEVPLGHTVEADMVHDALRRSEVDAVTLVHSETSTGALAPLAEIAQAVRSFDDVMLLVDGVTSIGGSPVESDALKLDFAFTGSQKALALPPGLALGVASERMVERAKTVPNRGGYLDLLAYDAAFADRQPTNTPAISLFYALEAQLERIDRDGGMAARWERHETMQRRVETWTSGPGGALGYRFLPRERRRSWTVSCLEVPDGRNGRTIVQGALRRGWTIGSGYGPLKERTIRIGHMGDHSPERLEELLAVVEEVSA